MCTLYCTRSGIPSQGAENWEKLREGILANSNVIVPEYYLKQFHACEFHFKRMILSPMKVKNSSCQAEMHKRIRKLIRGTSR